MRSFRVIFDKFHTRTLSCSSQNILMVIVIVKLSDSAQKFLFIFQLIATKPGGKNIFIAVCSGPLFVEIHSVRNQ